MFIDQGPEPTLMYTIGVWYNHSLPEIFLFLPSGLAAERVQGAASILNVLVRQIVHKALGVDDLVGHTVQEVLGEVLLHSDANAELFCGASFEVMPPAEKQHTMGYALWFYLNFADVDCHHNVPFVKLDLTRITDSK
eukprot:TRINITY_DN7844_c0_g1_i1.p1 TRINITY_DN7844_c0_g1~~TRINITY_DN7844_c0_g1_i1.p1  ORF type:complete len:137 (+),score=32.51 TRINITY_DN7844_c0_g1_i1:258-668(+)